MAFTASWIYQIVDKYSGPMKKIRRQTERMNKSVNKARKSVSAFGAKMSSAQSGIASFAGMLGGAMMLRTFTSFESIMNKVQGVTLATDEEFTRLRNKAKELGETTRFSATQAASGIEMLGRNGLRTTQIMGGAIDATLKLSAATGADLANSANIATDVMANFGKSANELLGIVDQIAGVTINSKFSIDDYRLALGQAGGVAGAVGVSLEDFNASIAGMAPLFKSGSDAGTAYKTFLQRLVPQSKEAKNMMKKLGLEFFDSNGQMKDMGDISELLKNSFSKLNEKQKTQAATTIFGTDAMRAAFGLAAVGKENFAALSASIEKVSATKLSEDRMRGLSGVMLTMASAWEAVQIAIFDSGLDIVLIKIFNGVTNLMRAVVKTNPMILKIAGIMGLLAVAIGPVLMVMGFLAMAVSSLMAIWPVLAGIVTVSISPFIAIGAAIAFLVALVVRAFTTNSKLRDSFMKLMSAISPLLAPFKLLWDMMGGMEGTAGKLLWLFDLLATIVGGVLVVAFDVLAAAINSILAPLKLVMKGADMLFGSDDGGVAAGAAGANKNTLSGKIEVAASGGAQVKSAEMSSDSGGDLGFNMGGA